MHIQIPLPPPQPITIIKGKVPHVKPAKRSEVPEFYRKHTLLNIKPYLYEILLYVVGFTELVRKEVTKWIP